MEATDLRDSIAVHLLCLTPLQRARLEAVALLGRPARVSDVAAPYAWNPSDVYRDLEKLVGHGLLDRLGSGKTIWYSLPGDVREGMKTGLSIGFRSSPMDAVKGMAVLRAARELIEGGQTPRSQAVGLRAGISQRGAYEWMGRLRLAGLIPDDGRSRSLREWSRNTRV